MVKTYEIRQIEDFYNVPEDRLFACLDAFGNCINAHRAMKQSMKEVARCFGHNKDAAETDFNHFTWIDDGKNDITIEIATEETHLGTRS